MSFTSGKWPTQRFAANTTIAHLTVISISSRSRETIPIYSAMPSVVHHEIGALSCLFHQRNWILSQKINCIFLPKLQLFSLQFLSSAYYLCFTNISTSRPTLFLYLLNLTFPNRFLTTRLFQIVFNIFHICNFNYNLGTNNLNSADVPLSNKQTNKQTNKDCFEVVLRANWVRISEYVDKPLAMLARIDPPFKMAICRSLWVDFSLWYQATMASPTTLPIHTAVGEIQH